MKKIKGIQGFIEAYITNNEGNKKKVYENSNIFYVDFEEALAKHIYNNYDIALDNQFTTTTPGTYEDGIVAIEGTNFIAFVGTVSQPAANQLRVTGIYTNATGATVSVISPTLGKGWLNSPYFAFNDFRISNDVGWAAQSVPDGQTLTIVWTITFTAH